MYDEYEIPEEMLEEQTREPSLRERMAASNQRNAANNANAVRNAADIASKSANPYAKAIGGAVKAADKISGGRASQALGKNLNLANKLAPGGRLAQAALNKMSESGAADRISNAVNKKNQNMPSNNKVGNNHSSDLGHNQNNDNDNNAGESGVVSYKATVKIIITALMVMSPIMLVIIFCCLFIAASQIFINSIDIGTADSLSDGEIKEDNLDNEVTDDHENLTYIPNSDTYVLDVYNEVNYVQIARKYNEADLEELEDFYGTAIYQNSDINVDADMNIVYNFYFKLYYIYMYYYENYDRVKLDLPLLMATLNVQSKDKTVVFGSNTIGYDSKKMKSDYEGFAYDKIHNYVSTRTSSEHDIEVLAQNMVSYQAKESCIDSNGKVVKTNTIRDNEIGTQILNCEDNQTYNVTEPKYARDEEKYREFLPKFLEEKYFLNESSSSNDSSDEYISEGNTKTCSLTIIGNKYYKTVYPQTATCSVSPFNGTEKGLEPAFYKNLKALIEDAKTKGCNADIISGHRTYEKQKYLYNCYITKTCNNGNMAAQPGYSNHEYGIAADLSYYPYTSTCLNYYHTNAAKYGLEFPLLYASFPEDWHIEPIDIIVGSPQE